MIYQIISYWNYFVLLYFLIVNFVYTILILISFFSIKAYLKKNRVVDLKKLIQYAKFLKPISVLAPAYNEEKTVVENVRSLLDLNYPEYEIILINDGSADGTLNLLIEAYQLEKIVRASPGKLQTKLIKGIYGSQKYPNLFVLDKENGGKADALNAGINASRYPIFTAIDTDSLLESNVLLQMVRPFLEDPNTVAVGGVVRIINGCSTDSGNVSQLQLPDKLLPLFQIVEYFRAFLFGRVGWEALNMLLIISGAFGMFNKAAVLFAGGYRTDTVGEDMELITRLHRVMKKSGKRYRIRFLPEPVCWTEAPETLGVLSRQRNRWHRGLLESIRFNFQMVLNPRYGRMGLFAIPFALFVEGLGPIIEFTGYLTLLISWYLGTLDPLFAITFLAAAILLGVAMSTSALVVEEMTFRRYPGMKMIIVLFFVGIVENFGYRQMNAWWRLKAIFDFLIGKKSWGKMQRSGFTKKQTKETEDNGNKPKAI
ncbi:glycosyltransferase family 2 protein [bacterium]|nr:glycosyltransferase family 2 protein [bacterium]